MGAYHAGGHKALASPRAHAPSSVVTSKRLPIREDGQMMQTSDTKRRSESMKTRQSRERIRRWQKTAGTLARTNPSWNVVKIAHRIQRSAAGRKRNGSLTYSIDFILRNIRGGGEISL